MGFNHCIIDSSVFVAFYRDIDSQHANALQVMREIADRVFVVHPYVIQETATVLTYRCGVDIAQNFLKAITIATNIVISAVDSRSDIDRFIKTGKKMSFTDIALIELSLMTGARIVTFDEQILALARV